MPNPRGLKDLEEVTDFHFPKAGIDQAGPFGRQPARQGKGGEYVRTTAFGANVRTFDVVTGRDRGGSRCGIIKYIPQQFPFDIIPASAWAIQLLGTLATTTPGVTAMQTSASGRVVYLIAVSQGVVKVATPDDTTWTATTNNTGETPALNITGVMQSTSVNQKQFFVDGTNYVYFNPPTNSVEKWTPTAGQLPRDDQNNGARLITTWRGRAVLSGLLRDPQNWFMSRVADPFDFDYAPDANDVTKAVAGNNSRLGLVGDVITGIIPYTDDVLIVGGDSTIYKFQGDPADGGYIGLVSDITGMAFGEAWCKDPYGNVYFFGSRPGVWKMAGPNEPQRISQPIEPLLRDINTGENVIRLVWDDREQCVHLWITPDDAPAVATHFVWEFRSNSWWIDTYANNNLNPLCCVAYDGNDPNDRVVLIGSWDGFVRALDSDATTDDGTAIASSVLIGPIMTPNLDDMLLKELQWTLGEQSGSITWEVMAADTPEAAVAAAARASGTAGAGRNLTQPIRVANHAIYIRISSTSRWIMESLRTVFGARGKVRRRGS